MQVHNPYAREDAISRLRDERDAEMRRADAADDLVAELRAERAAALARAEADEARALAEHQAAADLLAVIARIGECLGIPYSKPDLCHAVEAEVKRLRGRVAELEAALDAERAAHQWRPVTEEPDSGRYWVRTRDGTITTDLFLFGDWLVLSGMVTHYMPMPDAPQEPPQ